PLRADAGAGGLLRRPPRGGHDGARERARPRPGQRLRRADLPGGRLPPGAAGLHARVERPARRRSLGAVPGRHHAALPGLSAISREDSMVRSSFAALILLALLAACQTAPSAAPRPSAPQGATAPPTAAAAPTTAAAAAPTAPASLETVRVGSILNSSDAPFYLAQERGYLREVGLDLEITRFDGAQQAIAPLGADQLDVAGGAPGPGLFNAILRGVNVRIVTDRSRAVAGTRFNCMLVRKSLLDNGTIRSFADFRGRTFAEN